MAPSMSPVDPCSFSRSDYYNITDLSLDLTVDFEQQKLKGSATLTIEKRDHHEKRIVSAKQPKLNNVHTFFKIIFYHF